MIITLAYDIDLVGPPHQPIEPHSVLKSGYSTHKIVPFLFLGGEEKDSLMEWIRDYTECTMTGEHWPFSMHYN